MTCWTRHLVDEMAAAGVDYNKENRKKIDQYVRDKFKLDPATKCPEIWKEHVKPMLTDEKKKIDFEVDLKKLFI